MRHKQRFFGLLAVCAALLPLQAFSQAKPKPAVLPKACVACHAEEAKYPVRGARSQYLTSGHRKLGHASYANSEGCQGCHTHEGFVERVKKGKVDPKAVVVYPSEIGCFTCHAPHEKGDFSLRTAAKVTLTNGVVIDKGKSNLCAGCHRVLYVTKDEVKSRSIPFDFWGPHHGPQADMLAGTNAYEFPGRKYSSSAHAMLPKADCVTCHMSLPDRRYALEPAIGGHSFNVGGEVNGAPKLNNAGCLGSGCHGEMNQVPGKHVFARNAAADYDGDGKVEAIQEEVEGLLERFINKQGTGLLQTMKDPLYDPRGGFIRSKTEHRLEVVAALYNYKFVLEDRSKGIHNSKYAVQLLMDSIKALDPSFDDSRRPE
jgi:hypothetical protein